MSSLPSRQLKVEEIDDLSETDRFDAAFSDDKMKDVWGYERVAVANNVVLITEDHVSAAVFIEEDETWYRVYSEPRSEAVLTDAYEAVREVRDHDDLFDRHALTIEEAVFRNDRPGGEETSGYSEGEMFECPVCDGEHRVKFHEDEHAAEFDDFDSSYLYVECPDTRGEKFRIEHQASTPSG
jgi:hypothetical protein